MIIGINAGHTISGQPGSGAIGYINESNETRIVAKKLINLLCNQGHIVYDCTNDIANSELSNLRNIVNLANSENLDLFISIHFNAGGGKGTECYTYSNQSKAYKISEKITNNISKLGFVNRGTKVKPSLYVLKNTKAPALLVEVCFVDTKSDAELYNEIGSEKIAYAIAQAIDDNIVYKSNNEKSNLDVHYLVDEFSNRGIISDKQLWYSKLETDVNSYWLAKKSFEYIKEIE